MFASSICSKTLIDYCLTLELKSIVISFKILVVSLNVMTTISAVAISEKSWTLFSKSSHRGVKEIYKGNIIICEKISTKN